MTRSQNTLANVVFFILGNNIPDFIKRNNKYKILMLKPFRGNYRNLSDIDDFDRLNKFLIHIEDEARKNNLNIVLDPFL